MLTISIFCDVIGVVRDKMRGDRVAPERRIRNGFPSNTMRSCLAEDGGMKGFYYFIASVVAGLVSNLITTYFQRAKHMDISTIVICSYFVLMAVIAILAYRHHLKLEASTRRVDETEGATNNAIAILQDIGNGKSNNESALWDYGKHGYSTVPNNNTWQEWIKGLVKTTDRPDLDYYNFGKEFYFYDLSTGKSIEIPAGNRARTEKVGSSIRKGMVLRLMLIA